MESTAVGARAADIEAPVNASNGRLGLPEQQATARTEGPATVGAHPAEPGDGAAASPAAPSSPLRLEVANLPFLALGFTAAAALLFIVSDIIINHSIHPASTGVFLLLSLCWVIFKRHNSDASSQDGSRRANALTKEAREELLTYFVFPDSETETETGARGAGGAQRQTLQQQPKGNGSAGGRDVLQESRTSNRSSSSGKERGTGSKGWRWMSNGGDNNGGEAGADERDSRADTHGTDDTDHSGLFPAGTVGPSPRPASPCPPSTAQLFDVGGYGVGSVLSSAATGEAAALAAPAACARVTRVVRELLEEEKEKERQEVEQAGSHDDDQSRSGDLPLVDVRGNPVIGNAAGAGGTGAIAASTKAVALGGTGSSSGAIDNDVDAPTTPSVGAATVSPSADEVPSRLAPAMTTPTEPATEPATAAVPGNDESVAGRSDSGEWSTDRACIVCFGDYAPGDMLCRLPCRHVYHAECINEWLDRAKVPCCPLCKTDLLLSRSEDTSSAAAARSSGGAAVRGVEHTTGEDAV